MDEQTIHKQFVDIALALTPPILRNRNIQEPKEAVATYMQVYDAVLQAAMANDQTQQPPAAEQQV